MLIREPVFADGCYLYDENGIKLFLTGSYKTKKDTVHDGSVIIEFEAVLINDSDKQIFLSVFGGYVNGWNASAGSELGYVNPGKKSKNIIKVYTNVVTVENVAEELEDVEFDYVFFNGETQGKLTDYLCKIVHFSK